jgi:hypothetical protein
MNFCINGLCLWVGGRDNGNAAFQVFAVWKSCFIRCGERYASWVSFSLGVDLLIVTNKVRGGVGLLAAIGWFVVVCFVTFVLYVRTVKRNILQCKPHTKLSARVETLSIS